MWQFVKLLLKLFLFEESLTKVKVKNFNIYADLREIWSRPKWAQVNASARKAES